MTFRVELRVRNAALYRAIFATHESVSAFCREHRLQDVTVGSYLNLKKSALTKEWEWTKSALALADALGVLPDEIFPEACRARMEITQAAFEVDESDIAQLVDASSPMRLAMDAELAEDVQKTLAQLSDRDRLVLRARFGFDGEEKSLHATGEMLGVTTERVRQIEAKALRKLRHESRLKFLAGHCDDSDNEYMPA